MNKISLLSGLIVSVTLFTGCTTTSQNSNIYIKSDRFDCNKLYEHLNILENHTPESNYQKKEKFKSLKGLNDAIKVKDCSNYSDYKKQNANDWNKQIEKERAINKDRERERKLLYQKRLAALEAKELEKKELEKLERKKRLAELQKELKEERIIAKRKKETRFEVPIKKKITNYDISKEYRIVTKDNEIIKNMKKKKIITKYYSKNYKGENGNSLPFVNHMVQQACNMKSVKDAITIHGFQARFKFYNKYGNWLATHNLNLSCSY